MAHTVRNFFIHQALDHPKRSILISIVLTGLIGLGIPYVVIDDDIMNMFPHDNATMRTWETVLDEFGSTERIFVAFGHPGENAVNAQALADMWDYVRTVEAVPEVDEVFTIATMNRIDSEDGFMEVSDLQPRRDLSPEEVADIQSYLEENPEFKVRVVSRDGDYLNVVVQPLADANDSVFRNALVSAADSLLADYDVHFGGHAYLAGSIPAMMRDDVLGLMRIGLLIMVVIMLANLRSVPGVGMVLSVIILSLIAMMGFMGWLRHFTGSNRIDFTLLNTSMPIILLTIANSDGVHVLTKFFRRFRQLGNKREAIKVTMESLMLPISLTSLTTIAAFLSIVFAPLTQFMGYGLSIGFGIAWAWLLSCLLLPSLIMVKSWSTSARAIDRHSIFERLTHRIGHQVTSHPKLILSSGIFIVAIGIIGLLRLEVEVNLAAFFDEETEIRKSIDFLDQKMTGTMDLEVVVEGDLKEPGYLMKIDSLQSYLESKPQVTTTISIADVIKQMHRVVMDDDPAFEVIPDSRGKVNNLFTLYSMSGDPDDFSSLVDYDYKKGLVTALMRNMGTSEIIGFTQELQEYIATLDDGNLHTTVTGMLVILRDLIDLILRSAIMSMVVSVIVIFIIIWIFFKRIIWGLLAIIPLLSAVILNFGFMGVFGVELSHVTALLSSIIIGVGVDFAIHYISQFRRSAKRHGEDKHLSEHVVGDVGYPIILDAASNMGFGALLISTFLPVQYIGGLMVFAMVSTSLGTLTLLASLTEIFKKRLIRNHLS